MTHVDTGFDGTYCVINGVSIGKAKEEENLRKRIDDYADTEFVADMVSEGATIEDAVVASSNGNTRSSGIWSGRSSLCRRVPGEGAHCRRKSAMSFNDITMWQIRCGMTAKSGSTHIATVRIPWR
ncbi:MAG: hypothetical protein IPM94_15655 [bacterium]|nr:hypothetical protein [bacterium]